MRYGNSSAYGTGLVLTIAPLLITLEMINMLTFQLNNVVPHLVVTYATLHDLHE